MLAANAETSSFDGRNSIVRTTLSAGNLPQKCEIHSVPMVAAPGRSQQLKYVSLARYEAPISPADPTVGDYFY